MRHRRTLFSITGSTAAMKEGMSSWYFLKAYTAYLSFFFTNVLIMRSFSGASLVALRMKMLGSFETIWDDCLVPIFFLSYFPVLVLLT